MRHQREYLVLVEKKQDQFLIEYVNMCVKTLENLVVLKQKKILC